MAAAVKYLLTFRDRYSRIVIIAFITSGYAGLPIGLTAGADPLHISYDGDDGDIFQTMITSKAKISILLQEDNSEFYEDMSTMDENTFGVMVTIRNLDATLAFRWDGWLVPDGATRNFSYFNQEIVLTAIDPIGRTKGQKLLSADGAYIYAKQTMKYIIQRCFMGVFTPENTFATFNLIIYSDLVLSNTTTTVLPDIFDQLLINSEAFNDDLGRPVSAYDVVERIANSLFMRVFYENGNIYFVDILNYGGLSSTAVIELNSVYYKGYSEFISEGNNTMLVENSENITRTRTYRESICKFQYAAAVGLLKDGNLNNWTPIVGGNKLTEWYYNSYLSARPDVGTRRKGTGRSSDPYSILLTFTNGSTTAPITDRRFDSICGKTSKPVLGFHSYSLKVRFKVPNYDQIPPIFVGSDLKKLPNFYFGIYVYNQEDPTKSLYFAPQDSGQNSWFTIDLSGTSFASGIPDWSVIDNGLITVMSVGAPDIFWSYRLDSLYTPADGEGNDQEITLDNIIPTIAGHGDMYVFIRPCFSPKSDEAPQSADTLIYSVLLTENVLKKTLENVAGEVQYISRQIRTSQDNVTREIEFNTTANDSVAGALANAIPYTETSGIVPAGTNLSKIALRNYFEPLFSGVLLIAYNAICQMWLNYPQYQIDFETMGNDNFFWKAIDMRCFADDLRPSTDIYNYPFIQNRSDYDVKNCRRKITAISMRSAIRTLSKDTLDDTHDLSEFLYLK